VRPLIANRRHANHRVNEIRRLEQAASGQAIPRGPLLTAAERLTPRPVAQRDALLLRYPALAALYRLKEPLRAVFRCAAEATQALSRWRVNAEACDHAEGRVWGRAFAAAPTTRATIRDRLLRAHRPACAAAVLAGAAAADREAVALTMPVTSTGTSCPRSAIIRTSVPRRSANKQTSHQ
jgi:hypothetical protein